MMKRLPFDSRNLQYKAPFGAIPLGQSVEFYIRPNYSYSIQRAFLVINKDEEAQNQLLLSFTGREEGCDIFHGTFSPEGTGLYWYSFLLESENQHYYISQSAFGMGRITFFPESKWQLTVYQADFTTPGWIKGGILYQIFPDRFCKAGPASVSVPSDRRMQSEWGALPDYQCFETQTDMNNDYFGGNLLGIESKLDYLCELGVTALYLNPIFEAHSNHRYNTANYEHIDPLLGSPEDFIHLCEKAGEKNIRIILDGVFNHTGDDSIYFNRYGRYTNPGAYQSTKSDYIDWFEFYEWPKEYHSWWGIMSLPTLNKANPDLLYYLLGEDGIAAKWLRAGASGWRLDVADELPLPFLMALRERVKAENPDALIIGEVWEDASNKISYSQRRHYLEGKLLDSVMNYPFKEAILHFMKHHDAVLLNHRILSVLENYPKPVIDVLMNILGTHDTKRILTELQGESSDGKTREWKANTWLSERDYQYGLRKTALAASILYFLPGVPCIYYGDEIGLEGYEDPFNRRCFLWDRIHSGLTDWFRRLGSIRRSSKVLAAGEYLPLVLEPGFYSFLRKDQSEGIVCAVNLNHAPLDLNLTLPYRDLSLIAELKESNSDMLTIAGNDCKIYRITL